MFKSKSFTLIEIMVVVFIMALMSAIVIVTLRRGYYEQRQNDNTRKRDINELAAAIEEFKSDHGHYPLINWYEGKHAYEAVGGFSAECNGTISNFKPSNQNTPGAMSPGTEIKFFNGNACDDLSLQLLGRAYLPKMPIPTTPTDDGSVIGQGAWETSGKKYLDSMPQDPALAMDWTLRSICNQNCSSLCGASYRSSANYDPASCQIYRYFYNTFYNCPKEGIAAGDRYWLNAIMQIREDGMPGAANADMYFYEVGTMNFQNAPQSSC